MERGKIKCSHKKLHKEQKTKKRAVAHLQQNKHQLQKKRKYHVRRICQQLLNKKKHHRGKAT